MKHGMYIQCFRKFLPRVFSAVQKSQKRKKLEKYKQLLIRLYTISHGASLTPRAIWYIKGSVLTENNRLCTCFWRRDGRLSELLQHWVSQKKALTVGRKTMISMDVSTLLYLCEVVAGCWRIEWQKNFVFLSRKTHPSCLTRLANGWPFTTTSPYQLLLLTTIWRI